MFSFLSLSKLSNAELLFQTKNLVAEERRVLTQVLDHLAEVYRRRLFAGLGYSSLYDYAVRELGYSEAAAQRRVASVQLMQELPEVRAQVESGALSLSAVAQARSFFRKEKTEKREKRAILKKLEHQSSRQWERVLISLSSDPGAYQRPDRVRPVSETHSEVRFTASDALLEDLETIRGFLAHRKLHLSMAELIHEMAQIALDKLDPARKPDRRRSGRKRSAQMPEVLELGPAVERESAPGLAESGDGQVKKETEPKTSTPASEVKDQSSGGREAAAIELAPASEYGRRRKTDVRRSRIISLAQAENLESILSSDAGARGGRKDPLPKNGSAVLGRSAPEATSISRSRFR